MEKNVYTIPPSWFTKIRGNEKASLRLTRRGWEAFYPSGRTEIVVAMKNVPVEYLTTTPVNAEKAPEVKPESVVEVKEETPEVKVEEVEVKEETPEVKEEEAPAVEEQPKKKSRSKKQIVDE